MSLAEHPSLAACPACAAAPAAGQGAARLATPSVQLSLPGIHCAGCISGVERALSAVDGVTEVRVNLTRKRVEVAARAGVTAETLVGVLADAGYEAHELDPGAVAAVAGDETTRDLVMRLAVAGFAMMNVMLLSVAVWSGATEATRDLFHWISAAIALPTVAFSARPFFASALGALKGRRLNMDVPISLAILLASGMSLYETASGGEHAYFDAALSLTFFLLAGRYLDQRTRMAARSAAAELTALEVPRALRATGEIASVADLGIGDEIRLLPGARCPVDGVVTDGASEIDRSLITGESLPERIAAGQSIAAGETNLTGPLIVRALSAGTDTSLRRMADLVAVAENARSRHVSLADRAARIYAPLVHILALLAFLGWMVATGDVRLSLNIAVAVLIITCPCALGLAVPAVSTAASGRLFRRGLLVKNATALERLAEVDHVIFDKTGTLTEGRPTLEEHQASPAEAAVAAALAQGSAHPLAKALAGGLGVPPASVKGLREVPGQGVEGLWQGRVVRLGRADWVGADATGAGTATWLRIGEDPAVAFHFRDTPRPGAAQAIAALRRAGCSVELLSGDTTVAVADLAGRLGIADWRAGLRPDEKLAHVRALGEAGHKVLMVGDGLNDTAALAAAHASISPASALDASRTVSDIVLLGGDLSGIGEAVSTARSATRRILENFGIAALYNLIAVPLALAGLATPLAAALAMSFSSIMVTLNAMRLR
jgi:Cu2+-exporting ATPase